MDIVGVLLNDQGEVFTFDREPTHREVIEQITIKGPDGTVLPAEGRPAPDQDARPNPAHRGQAARRVAAAAIRRAGEVTAETKLFVATMGIGK